MVAARLAAGGQITSWEERWCGRAEAAAVELVASIGAGVKLGAGAAVVAHSIILDATAAAHISGRPRWRCRRAVTPTIVLIAPIDAPECPGARTAIIAFSVILQVAIRGIPDATAWPGSTVRQICAKWAQAVLRAWAAIIAVAVTCMDAVMEVITVAPWACLADVVAASTATTIAQVCAIPAHPKFCPWSTVIADTITHMGHQLSQIVERTTELEVDVPQEAARGARAVAVVVVGECEREHGSKEHESDWKHCRQEFAPAAYAQARSRLCRVFQLSDRSR